MENLELKRKCGDCVFLQAGHCRMAGRDVGYFETACDDFQPLQPDAAPAADKPKLTKVCKACGRELPLDKFGGHNRTADKKQPLCRECMSAKLKGVKKGQGLARHPELRKKIRKPAEDVEVEKVLNESIELCKPLEEYTAQELYDELKKRGWSGELTKIVKTVLK